MIGELAYCVKEGVMFSVEPAVPLANSEPYTNSFITQ